MTRKSIGRAVVVATAGFFLFTTAPTRAAPSADNEAAVEQTAEPSKPLALTKAKKSRVHKASRNRKAAKVAALKLEKKAKQEKEAAVRAADKPMSSSVANANAQMPSTDARGAAAIDDAPLDAAAAEQLSELGKSLAAPPVEEPRQMAQLAVTDQPQTAPPLVAPEPTRPLKQARVTSSDDAWTQSSLIGKIFIAFGGMLTLASAARMLIA